VHERFVAAYLAGPVAERIFVEGEGLPISEADTDYAGRFDKQMAEERLARMERSVALGDVIQATYDLLSGWMWAAITDFAAELLKRRRIDAHQAMSLASECLRRYEPPAEDA
jgi:hypothetical protein